MAIKFGKVVSYSKGLSRKKYTTFQTCGNMISRDKLNT